MLKQVDGLPTKMRLQDYLPVMWAMRRKGYGLREIAEMLTNNGVKTDHTAVHRLLVAGNPLYDYNDSRVLVGDAEYESRKGKPLRPYRSGLFVQIIARKGIYALESYEKVSTTWCEAHYELNHVPNDCWLQQLGKELDMSWDPERPWHLQERFGVEVKFEGTTMAVVCPTYNLKDVTAKVLKAILKASEYFLNDKDWRASHVQMVKERRGKILSQRTKEKWETDDESYEQYERWRAEQADRLTKEFEALPI